MPLPELNAVNGRSVGEGAAIPAVYDRPDIDFIVDVVVGNQELVRKRAGPDDR